VGKTTTAINLGTGLAAVGKRVLIIDLDPQGNASTGLGIARTARERGSYEMLMNDIALSEATRPAGVPGLSVVPSSIDLSGAEVELVVRPRRQFRLKDCLGRSPTPYDYIFVDCPPSLNLLTVNALVAADSVLVPLQCEFFALEGLSQLLRTVDRARAVHNPRLRVQGIVLTMFDGRNKLSDQVAADVRGHLGDKVFDTVIPRNVRISEAPSHGQPALLYDSRCSGSQAYMRLAGEMLRRERAQAA
jgi:chromosome partitioning protein